jgi:hypothetical protein
MSITHSKVSAIPDGADTSVVRPSDWNAGHSIAPWTDNGSGSVKIVSTDATKTPLTVSGIATQQPVFRVVTADTVGNKFETVFSCEDTTGVIVYSVDSSGQMTITARDASASGLTIFPATGAAALATHVLYVAADGGGTLLDVEADGQVSIGKAALSKGLKLKGPLAAPADASLNNSNVTFWLDATPGATKLMIKAKDSGGTVRTAAIALT